MMTGLSLWVACAPTDTRWSIDHDHARLPSHVDTMLTNHGGLAVVGVPGVSLKLLDTGAKPRSFELLCVRVVSRSSSCVVVLVYRPPSESVSAFFKELSDVLDRVITYTDPLFVVGDVNIHLERAQEPSSRQFVELLDACGIICCITSPTHDDGGRLDVVAARDDFPTLSVDVVDVGLSDHRLLRWSAPLIRRCPVYTSVECRPHGRFYH